MPVADERSPSSAIKQPTLAGPHPDPHAPRVPLPPGACDCHAHVFGPQSAYPYVPNAGYIPPDALPGEYARMLRTLGCGRGVLVQPSVYGADNCCMIAALTSGDFEFRGVAVVHDDVAEEELDRLHRAGVRGVRINLEAKTPGLTLAQAPRLARKLEPLGWHLQFFVRISRCAGLEKEIAQLPVPCVIDHFANIPSAAGPRSPEFQALLRLARLEHVWFKLIGPYRISTQWPLYPDVAPLAQALVQAAPDRCVWGTDWPHPEVDYMPNDGDLADALVEWLPDPDVRRQVLVDNPSRLYGFSRIP
jgi:2-pyrone-4,6-dicarboxylate lactonase